jgi:GIY-YIG catalytic domain
MGWSDWIKCDFDSKGNIDIRPVENKAPKKPGVYAIAGKDNDGYRVEYIGMSRSNIQARIKAHLKGNGNSVLKKRLQEKTKGNECMPLGDALYFMYLETSPTDASWMEATYVQGTMTISNLQKNLTLPKALRETKLKGVELED